LPIAVNPGTQYISQTAFVSPKVGWVATQAGIFLTKTAGARWVHQWPQDPEQVALAAFSTHGYGWLVMQSVPATLWVTTDDGRTWRAVRRSFPDITGLTLWGPGRGLVVGSDHVLWTTRTFGKSWRRSDLPFAIGTGMGPYVQFPSAHDGFLATVNLTTRLWATHTGGRHWTEVRSMPDGFMADFQTASRGWVLVHPGSLAFNLGRLERTDNGGKSWRSVGTVPTNALELDFLNARAGWILYPHFLLSTRDGGRRWTRVNLPGVSASSLTTAGRTVYLVTQGGRLLASWNGGRRWREVVR
jgi:photosystem II stability/assembly factor-like uncharacterized protein